MRFSLVKLVDAGKKPVSIHFLGRPSTMAMGRKYNYFIRKDTYMDELHGYGWWVIKNDFKEMWPLLTCMAIAGATMTYIAWWNFQKTEVQFNRYTEHRPWDWVRAQYVYEKRHKALFDDSAMWGRIPELDKLQAEMLEVKKQRLAEAKAARAEKEKKH